MLARTRTTTQLRSGTTTSTVRQLNLVYILELKYLDYCGSEDGNIAKFKPSPHTDGDWKKYPNGNLTDVQGSSFDPLFWYVNVTTDADGALH